MIRLFLLICFFSSPLLAQHAVHCPPIDRVQRAASTIDSAGMVNGAYIAATAPTAIHASKLYWFGVVYNIHAHSQEEAIKLARHTMSVVSSMDNVEAKNVNGIFVCEYDQRKVKVINQE